MLVSGNVVVISMHWKLRSGTPRYRTNAVFLVHMSQSGYKCSNRGHKGCDRGEIAQFRGVNAGIGEVYADFGVILPESG